MLRPVILKGSEGRPSLESSASDLKIFWSGDLAVVSGIQSFGGAGSGKTAFTYTLKKMTNGSTPQWMFAAFQHTPIQLPQSVTADEEAIKNVIVAATTAVYSKDIPGYKSRWVNAPYISWINAGTEGKVSKTVGDEFQKAYDDWEKNAKAVDIKVTRINGNSAFVIFEQHNQYPDGTNLDSIEERCLERVNNEWKLVNITVLPKK